ncbi:CD3324 family protein [Solidesulfovibrio alcoholivorans]|uniref:CD3324 family protein n=1 Tax=Solidesulfovibrio alcoholivorans TaxID=81406 RepID=UPI0005C1A92D|nr:CD3324 family protein [Solidesulfovibrio alcoholivorans]
MMAYTNASEVLPAQLLEAIQNHVDGAYLYIPRKEENRRRWGEGNDARTLLRARNAAIREKYLRGTPVEVIATSYCLSPKTVYKILAVKDTG